jgi:hypothetical protein
MKHTVRFKNLFADPTRSAFAFLPYIGCLAQAESCSKLATGKVVQL